MEAEFRSTYYINLPPSFEEQKRQAEQILWGFPRDIRLRYARAASLYEHHDAAGAERALLLVMRDDQSIATFPYIEPYARALLARIEFEQGDRAAAQHSLCGSEKARALAADLNLCR